MLQTGREGTTHQAGDDMVQLFLWMEFPDYLVYVNMAEWAFMEPSLGVFTP